MSSVAVNILKITRQLDAAIQSLQIEKHIPAVSHVYYPLNYAFDSYTNYVNKYCNNEKNVLFVGMNPSPHGMCQTGIPFGDVSYVKNWLKIGGNINIPVNQHPRYRIAGFTHRVPEISGSRLWGFLQKIYGEPDAFFNEGFVVNYCPVALISSGGSNLTPESQEVQRSPIKEKLEHLCDIAMFEIIQELKPQHIIGIGRYATNLCQNIVDRNKCNVKGVYYLRHPSPRSVENVQWWEDIFLKLLQQKGLYTADNEEY